MNLFFTEVYKQVKEHRLFCLMLAACALLRLAPLFHYQFTYDELSGLERTQFSSFSELMEKGVKVDAHPALVQLLIFCIVKLFGYHAWGVKLPFILFSFGAVIYGYALGLRHFSKQAGLLAALFLSFSLVFVFYAPIARMYISGVFFSMALLYYYFELIFLKNTTRANYLFFALFALLSGLNQHMNALFALTLYLSGFIVVRGKELRDYFLTGICVGLAYLPHLPTSLYQLGVGGIGIDQGGWLDKPDADAILGFVKILFGTGKIGWLVLAFVFISAARSRQYGLSRPQLILLMVFVLNYMVIYFYSIFRAAIYQHSMMLFSGMAFLALVTSLIHDRRKEIATAYFTLLFVALAYTTYVSKAYFSQSVKTVFEYQFERTAHYKKLYGAQEVFPVFFDADAIMKKIYFRKYATEFECVVSADTAAKSIAEFARLVSSLKCRYLVLASALPAQQAIAAEYFPYLLENTQTQGINFRLCSRNPQDSLNTVGDDVVLAASDPVRPGSFTYTRPWSGTGAWPVDSLNEFPYDAYARYHDFVKQEGNVILLEAKLRCRKPTGSAIEACINAGDPASGRLFGYAARAAREFVAGKDSCVTIYTDYFVGTSHPRVSADAKLGCYLWNRNKERAELLSFRIRLIDYWHKKWHFWD